MIHAKNIEYHVVNGQLYVHIQYPNMCTLFNIQTTVCHRKVYQMRKKNRKQNEI